VPTRGTTIAGVVFTGVTTGDQAGFAVAGSDVAWTGSSSAVLIGAPWRQVGAHAGAGTAYLIFEAALAGTVSLSRVANGAGDQVAGVVYRGAAAGERLGFSVAFPGNVTASSSRDLAIGAPWADPVLLDASQPVDAGTAYVPSGGALSTGVVDAATIGTTTAGARYVGIHAGMLMGYSVSGGGDSFADGRTDLLIGAPSYDHDDGAFTVSADVGLVAQASGGGTDGIIEVCNQVGVALAVAPVAGGIWRGAAAGDQLGTAVARVGDFNGNGFDDIALGAPFADPPGLPDAGRVYLIHGAPPSGPYAGVDSVGTVGTSTAGAVLAGSEAGEHAGSAIAGVGELDGHGQGDGDFVVGAPQLDANQGTVYIVLGRDVDGDGRAADTDCDPQSNDTWDVPFAVRDVQLSYNRTSGVTTLSWVAPLELGGVGPITYDTIRSPAADDFETAAACVETGGADTSSSETFTPPPGGRAFYLVMAGNACGAGAAGTSSSGAERVVRTCP